MSLNKVTLIGKIKHTTPPFLLDIIHNLAKVTPAVRVLNALWNKPPLAKCSSATFKSVALYTLWSLTKAMCKAVKLPNRYPSCGCNGDNRAAFIFGSFSSGTTLTVRENI